MRHQETLGAFIKNSARMKTLESERNPAASRVPCSMLAAILQKIPSVRWEVRIRLVPQKWKQPLTVFCLFRHALSMASGRVPRANYILTRWSSRSTKACIATLFGLDMRNQSAEQLKGFSYLEIAQQALITEGQTPLAETNIKCLRCVSW